MAGSETTLSRFLDAADSLACVVGASEAQEAYGDSGPLPAGWTAWGTSPLGEKRIYTRIGDALEDETERLGLVRTAPLRFEFLDAPVLSRDEFACLPTLVTEFKVGENVSDLAAFQSRIMGARTTMCRADLFKSLETKVRPLIRTFIRRHDAGELVDDLCADEFAGHFREGLAKFLFESGLTPCGGTSLRCESPQWAGDRQLRNREARHQRQQAMRDEVRTCRRQAREHHLQHIEPMLDRLQQLADASPDLELPDLLRTFSEQDRGEIYEALFKLRPPEQKTARVVAASAEELVFVDPAKPDPPVQRLPISGEPGQLRSIRLDHDGDGRAVLLAGARCGVYLLDAAGARPPDAFRLGGGERRLQGGVNSATLSGDTLLASHSEVGLVCWRLDAPDSAEALLVEQTRNAEAVRHVRRIGDFVWVTIDHRILRLPADDLRAEAAVCYEAGAIPITALCVGQARVLAGTQTGQVLAWDIGDPGGPQVLEHGRGRPVGSVQMLPGAGLERLVFADHSPGIAARFVDDVFACRYQGEGQEIRWSFAAADLLAGVNVPRDRLLLWHAYQPAEPYAVLPLAQLTGHSIQDICFIPQSAAV